MGRLRLGELLVDSKLITQAQLDEALAAPRDGNRKLGQVLVDMGFVSETQLTQTLSQQLSVPWVSLYHIDFSRELLNLVPKDIAEKYCLLPVFVRNVRHQGHTLYVAMDDPTNEQALAAVREASGLPTRPMIACPSDIRGAIRAYHGGGELPAPPKGPERRRTPPPAPLGELRRASESSASRVAEEEAPPPSLSGDSPDDEPLIEAREITPKKKLPSPRMVALTLLDGTTINVPAKPAPAEEEAAPEEAAPAALPAAPTQLTARELILALRAVAHGADAREVLGETRQWEPMFAALLSTLLKKGVFADWEFVEELKKL